MKVRALFGLAVGAVCAADSMLVHGRCPTGLEMTSSGSGVVVVPEDQVTIRVQITQPTYDSAKEVCVDAKARIVGSEANATAEVEIKDFTLRFQTVKEWNHETKQHDYKGMACHISFEVQPAEAATEIADELMRDQNESTTALNMQFGLSKEALKEADIQAISLATEDAMQRLHGQAASLASAAGLSEPSLQELARMATSITSATEPSYFYLATKSFHSKSEMADPATPGTKMVRQSVKVVVCKEKEEEGEGQERKGPPTTTESSWRKGAGGGRRSPPNRP